MNKSIVFVHQGANTATYRLRSVLPAKYVSKINGYSAAVNTGTADILVFSKPLPTDISMAEAAKEEGCKVVVDLADDHFKTPVIAKIYADIARHADRIVCPSPAMRDRIHAELGRDAEVIPDPYDLDEIHPHADGDKLLWHGNKTNLGEVIQWQDILKQFDLMVVTDKNTRWPDYVPWTLEARNEALASRNIVILPSQKGAEYKSANRLIGALRAGCFPVCNWHPAYKEFRQFAWVGNFPTGLKWALHFKNDLNDLVKAGQHYIRERYSPQTIGKQWAALFDSI